MSIPSRNIPREIEPSVQGLRALALTELRNGNYKRAETLYLKELEVMNQAERELLVSMHKGATYYNLGISRLLQNKGQDALRDIIYAYIEDLLSAPIGKEQEADSAYAYKTLVEHFKMTNDDLEPLKAQVQKFKTEQNVERWVRMESQSFIISFIAKSLGKASIPIIETHPTLDMIKEVGRLPEKNKSVFIGGPFKIAAYLRELRRIFISVRPNYTPYMSLDFTIPDERTHDDCMEILSRCAFAVFDVSTEAGQYAEIEHASVKGIPGLLVFSAIDESDKKKPPVPAMIRTVGFPIEGFCYLNELEEIFRKHLPEQPKQ